MCDIYKTIESPVEAALRERSSKFIAFAYPVQTAEQVKGIVDELRKKYYDATHHCFAYRLGVDGSDFRVNDDGEPSGTAGRPILGQMMSAGITNCLIVVVRWFGGTKLGVPGLISAYKEAAAMAIEAAAVVERTDDTILRVEFPYVSMNDVMRVVKEEQPRIIDQNFDNVCTMTLSIRKSKADALIAKITNYELCELRVE
jgi:uncharacterized YigZ family protein